MISLFLLVLVEGILIFSTTIVFSDSLSFSFKYLDMLKSFFLAKTSADAFNVRLGYLLRILDRAVLIECSLIFPSVFSLSFLRILGSSCVFLPLLSVSV